MRAVGATGWRTTSTFSPDTPPSIPASAVVVTATVLYAVVALAYSRRPHGFEGFGRVGA